MMTDAEREWVKRKEFEMKHPNRVEGDYQNRLYSSVLRSYSDYVEEALRPVYRETNWLYTWLAFIAGLLLGYSG